MGKVHISLALQIIRERNPKKLGCMAPIMVNDKSVSMCQLCKEPFTITFRRHHCRACGKVWGGEERGKGEREGEKGGEEGGERYEYLHGSGALMIMGLGPCAWVWGLDDHGSGALMVMVLGPCAWVWGLDDHGSGALMIMGLRNDGNEYQLGGGYPLGGLWQLFADKGLPGVYEERR